ncbi:hypothetical protein TNCV_3816561 [Trichonephila clavipes]|nr:hypothetical protein TNCV_3816561 [Trichonephila clavipes]
MYPPKLSPSQYGGYDLRLVTEWVRLPSGITDLKEDTRKYVADWATNIKPQGTSQIVRHGCKTLLRFVNVSFCNERQLNDNLKIILQSYGVDKYLPFVPVAIDMVLGGSNSLLLGAITKPCCFVIPQKIPARSSYPITLSEEFIELDDYKRCYTPIGAGKNILEFVQSSKNIIDADFNDENEMNNAAPILTSSEMRIARKIMRSYLDAHSNGEMN